MTTNLEPENNKVSSTKNKQVINNAEGSHSALHNVIPVLASALALFALLASLYSYVQQKNYRQQTNQQKEEMVAELAQLKNWQQSNREQFNSLNNAIDQKKSELNQQINSLQNKLQKNLSQQFYQKEDWLLLNAKHYLELAQMNAHWGHSPKATIALLEAADTALKENANSQIYSVRQAIAEEIASIKATPTFDYAGILSQIDAAQTLVNQIPAKNQQSNLTSTPTDSEGSWHNQWRKSLQVLNKLVVIKHHDEKNSEMLSPVYQSLLRESINMQLGMVQWAVLEQNEALYHQVLQQIISKIQRTFDVNAPATQHLLEQLQLLNSKSWQQQTVGNINQPLKLLNNYLNNSTKPAMSDDNQGTNATGGTP